MSFPLLAPGANRSRLIRAQAIALPGGHLQDKEGPDTDIVETKQHSGTQENPFGKRAMLEKLFKPVFKKSAPSPVRNRHEIPAQAAGFIIWYSFSHSHHMLLNAGCPLYKVLNWDMGPQRPAEGSYYPGFCQTATKSSLFP